MKQKLLLNKLIGYFIQGTLLLVPVSVILFFGYQAFILLDGLLPFRLFPGAGVIIIAGAVTLTGFIGNTLIAKPIKTFLTELLNKLPLIKTIYSAITDLLSAFVGQKRKFNQPVLVKLSKESNIEKLGFITQTDLTDFGLPEDRVSVYLPHSYNFSGNVFIVPRDCITLLDAKSADVMKFIVTGGVTKVEEVNENNT